MAKLLAVMLLVVMSVAVHGFTIAQVGAINWPFTVCGTGPWKMTSLTLSAQPSRNTNDDIIAKGNVNDYVEFDHVDLEVKLNGLFLHSEAIAYAKTYDSGDILEFKYTNFIPSFAPSGTYLLTFNFKDKAGKAVGCFNFTFKL